MKDFSGCNIERNWNDRWVKLTQPVMVQSFQEKLKLDTHGKYPMTPAKPVKVVIKG